MTNASTLHAIKMSIRIRLHPYLKKFTHGHEVVETTGQTIDECINDLEIQFPELKQQLRDEQGRLFSSYAIHINSSDGFSPEETSTPVSDGDELIILTIPTGG